MLDTVRFIYHIRRSDLLGRCAPEAKRTAVQEKRLRQLLRHAVKHSPFYRERLAAVDIETCPVSALPVLTKREFIANFGRIVTDPRIKQDDVRSFMQSPTNLGKKFLGKYVVCHTSGSQGESALLVQPQSDVDKTFAMQAARGHSMPKTWNTLWKKLFGEKLRWSVVLFRKSFFPSGAAFENIPGPMRKLANIQRLNINDPIDENLAKLNEFKPNIITAYAHVLENLARAELQGKLQLRQAGCLQHVTSISEPITDMARDYMQRAWDVPIANHYAMGECMGLTLGCSKGHGAHLNPDLAIFEVVDRQYRPVPPGTPGDKVLVTNLLNFTQPLIRYEIDDVVTLSPTPCPCGNLLPLISNVAGRSNDRLWYRRGKTYQEVAMYLFKKIAAGSPSVAEFQIHQPERNRFILKVEARPGTYLQASEVVKVAERELAYEQLTDIIRVDVEVVDEIGPDPRTGKLRRVISEVGIPEDLDAPPTEKIERRERVLTPA
jgi:phenylacetate-CoA ligase